MFLFSNGKTNNLLTLANVDFSKVLTFVSVILNVALVGAFIAGLAGLSPCAAYAACAVISINKTIFRPS